MFLLVIFIVLVVIRLLQVNTAYFPKVIRWIAYLYYVIITIVFIIGSHRIHTKYNMYDGPVIHEGWEVNTSWTFLFSFLYFIPLIMIILWTFIRTFQHNKKHRRRYIIWTLFALLGSFFLFVLFNLVYGLRP